MKLQPGAAAPPIQSDRGSDRERSPTKGCEEQDNSHVQQISSTARESVEAERPYERLPTCLDEKKLLGFGTYGVCRCAIIAPKITLGFRSDLGKQEIFLPYF